MAGARGYSSYRGRGGKLKIFLAAVLVVIIAAACLVLFLQRHIVYDNDGRPRLEFPWQTERPQEGQPPQGDAQDPEDLELVVQGPEGQPVQEEGTLTRFLAEAPLTVEAWEAWAGTLQEGDGVAVTLKDAANSGRVCFDASRAIPGAVQVKADTAAALTALTAREGLHAAARFSCLHDARAANSNVRAMGLRNTGGYIFYDGNNSQWLDPSKPAAREYLCGLAMEIGALGFDELILTDVSYPTVGKVNKIDYNGEGPIEENLALLLRELRTALEPFQVTLSIELPQEVILQGADPVSGQSLAVLAPLVDRVYAVTTPDQRQALADAVAAASPETLFVPQLPAGTPEDQLTGYCLLLPEEEAP